MSGGMRRLLDNTPDLSRGAAHEACGKSRHIDPLLVSIEKELGKALTGVRCTLISRVRAKETCTCMHTYGPNTHTHTQAVTPPAHTARAH